MLSRVAERIYWTARYIERVENTARLISVFNSLLLDLPKDVDLSWYTLIIINGTQEDFNDRYKVKSERNVLKFIISDLDNSSSLVNSMFWVRENIRTSRDVVPGETWELVNELNIFIKNNLQYGLNKSARHEFLEHIVAACQQIVGLIQGCMIRNAGWYFLNLGCNLERADMTTRFLDAGAAVLLTEDNSPNQNQIVWGNVLSSASAEMAYLKATGSMVKGSQVVEFLMTHAEFPRSIRFCLDRIGMCVKKLPRSAALSQQTIKHLESSMDYSDYNQLGHSFRQHLNTMQIGLCDLHDAIAQNWFQ
jgi:uncharacterized alpha-E superfamily protein